jgi:serine/threonine-protein kinase RsbW
VSTQEGEAVVELTIPGKPEYVGVARLAILGVASRMRFSYDEVEDIRLAVGEACTNAIERANGSRAGDQDVRIRCVIDPARLVVEVSDNAPSTDGGEPPAVGETGLDERGLGGVLIRILMDDVQSVEESDSGRRGVRMVKYVASAAR